MSILSTIATGTNSLILGSSALALVGSTAALVQKQGVRGIQNFLFTIPLSDSVVLTSQITDHYVEKNYAVQDHIAKEPIRITLTGNIAELAYTRDRLEAYAAEVLGRLGPLNILNPAGCAAAEQYLSQYNRTKQAILNAYNIALKTYGQIINVPTLNKQQEAFATFREWFEGRSSIFNKELAGNSLLTVETPWATFDNMAIESVSFSQDETSNTFSTIEVVLKQIRFVAVASGVGTLQGWAASTAGAVNKGVSQGQPADSVLFATLKGLFSP